MSYIDQIEPALIRPGRIDLAIPVPYPDAWSREAILEKNNQDVPEALASYIVRNTVEWPWSTYKKLCKKVDPAMSEDSAKELIDELSLEFQKTDYYYLNPKRWMAASPLAAELVHVAFSTAKEMDKCRERVEGLIARLPKKRGVRIADFNLGSKFDTEWRRERRS